MLALVMSIFLLPGSLVAADQQTAVASVSQNRSDVVVLVKPTSMVDAANETGPVSSRTGVTTENIAAPAISSTASNLVPAVVLNTPRPKPGQHRFFDKKNIVGFTVHGVTRVADAAQTCTLLGRPGRQEAWLPVNSCSGVVVYSFAMIPAQIGTSYVFHRRGRHKLERWLPYVWAAPSAAGVAFSFNAW